MPVLRKLKQGDGWALKPECEDAGCWCHEHDALMRTFFDILEDDAYDHRAHTREELYDFWEDEVLAREAERGEVA